MTTEEIINTLKAARAEVEWDYPIEYAAAIDEAIKALISPTQMSGTWIPVMDGDGQLPEVDKDGYSLPLLISTQCTIPAVGQYRVDETGGEFYDYDGDEPLSKIGIFVTAWMYLPESYKEG